MEPRVLWGVERFLRSAPVQNLATVRGEIRHPLEVTVPKWVGVRIGDLR